MIRASTHAVQRYVERVKPALTRAAAHEELQRLLPVCEVREEWPDWVHHTGFDGGEAEAVAVLNEGICFPVAAQGDDWVALTVLTRAGMGPEHRERTNDQARERRWLRGRDRPVERELTQAGRAEVRRELRRLREL